jgi:hypothetical protein
VTLSQLAGKALISKLVHAASSWFAPHAAQVPSSGGMPSWVGLALAHEQLEALRMNLHVVRAERGELPNDENVPQQPIIHRVATSRRTARGACPDLRCSVNQVLKTQEAVQTAERRQLRTSGLVGCVLIRPDDIGTARRHRVGRAQAIA